jgi:hypothetical protein
LAQLKEKVIDPAEAKANELAAKRHGKVIPPEPFFSWR